MTTRRQPPLPRRVAILVSPGVQSLDAIGPFEVFSIASVLGSRQGARTVAYRVELVAQSDAQIVTSSGLRLVPDRALHALRNPIDTLLVAGGGTAESPHPDPDLVSWLARSAGRFRRVGSVCTGAFLLARAGLLDGRRATTHWGGLARLAREFPRIQVEHDALYVRDGKFYTSAGITAGMDLALALVEEDHGRETALAVARQMVLFLKRPGGQSQFSQPLEAQTRATETLADLPAWIAANLDSDLSVARLAKQASLSPRQFSRVFAATFGCTPAKYVEKARVESARAILESGDRGLEEVADWVGFGSAERMRRSFQRCLAVVPQDYRQRFRGAGGKAGS